MNIAAVRKVGAQCTYNLRVSYDTIVKVLGFEPNCTDLDDPDKVKASWGFEVDGEHCGIWCYKYYGDPKNCDYWSFYGKTSIAEKLFGYDKIA